MALPVAIVAWLVAARVSSTRPVPVAAPDASCESRRVCATLIGALPDRLGELPARTVDGDRRLTAAWGQPPVVLRCGHIATPSPLGQLITLDGVDWTPVPSERRVTWMTVGRKVTVEVRVPRSYDSQAPLLAHLSPAIVRTVPAS